MLEMMFSGKVMSRLTMRLCSSERLRATAVWQHSYFNSYIRLWALLLMATLEFLDAELFIVVGWLVCLFLQL